MTALNTMSVGEFYRNRNVLITGATGFLGKVLLEKLLRSCEDIGTVYVLIRPKKGNTVEERLHKLLSQDVFQRLHAEKPLARNKVVAIAGDLADPQFSLNERDKMVLENVVSVVFHSAAIVKFDEELKYAINMNIGGSKHMIDLAKNMQDLKAFVFISTAYSNSDRLVIEEKYYPPQAPDHFWQDLILAAENMDEKELNALTPRLIGNLPNSYTFTKQIAESLVYDHKDEIPIVIYRPSIVVGAFFEPYPGWVDNINGANGVIAGTYTGFLRMVLGIEENNQDWIGVDYVVNGAIAASWRRNHLPAGKCPIYNCAAAEYCRNVGGLIRFIEEFSKKNPTEKTLWKPKVAVTASAGWFEINFIIFNVIPAFFIDIALKISGINFSVLRVCRKTLTLSRVTSHFSLNNFYIKNENCIDLYESMTADDKKIFNFGRPALLGRVGEIMRIVTLGIKKYILKDDMSEESNEILRKRVKYYDAADLVVKVMFYAFVANMIWAYIHSYLL